MIAASDSTTIISSIGSALTSITPPAMEKWNRNVAEVFPLFVLPVAKAP